MSETIDVEENGRRILEIFAFLEAGEGDVLGANNFVAIGRRWRWDLHELQLGLDHDLATGLVERAEGGGVRLTGQGLRIVGSMTTKNGSSEVDLTISFRQSRSSRRSRDIGICLARALSFRISLRNWRLSPFHYGAPYS